MIEWSDLPQGPHDSQEDWRRGDDWEPVPCGTWYMGGKVFCEAHEAYYEQEFPQGWQSYPGDVCIHGKYTGGCGIDWMCGPCEMGETHWYEEPRYELQVTAGSHKVPIMTFGERTPNLEDTMLKQAEAWQEYLRDVPDFARNIVWEVRKTSSGYWGTPPLEDA